MDKEKIGKIVSAVFIGGILLIALIGVIASITACVMYGNKPITEVPMWAIWFLT